MTEWKPLSELVSDVLSGTTTAVELVQKSLENIENHQEFQAIISVTQGRALQRAAEIDAMIASGKNPGRLAGVPFIAKDNFLVFGSDTTAASNMLRGFEAPYQSTAINRLEAEGAICVAKANLDAFAHGSSTENSDFMTTLNPHDKTKVPGGSSGGSAAAVALQLAPFSLGTDTGGSIRLPASFCGVVGLKPTYGLVSRSGVVAMASSTDVIGPISQSVQDAALVLECMSGKDQLDATTIDRDEAKYDDLDSVDVSEIRIGVIEEYFGKGLDEEVRKSIDNAVAIYEKMGHKVTKVSIPSLQLALAVYYVLCPAEVSSNLSRYDGQRYGYFSKDADDLDASYSSSRAQGFGDEAMRRIMIGTYVLSSGYYDAYYQKAQLVRTKLIEEFTKAFEEVDVLVGPTAPVTAFKVGENVSDPLKMYLIDIMTVAANLVGVPSISIPVSPVDAMPVGLQIMAPQKADRQLLAFAKRYQEASK